MTDARPSTWTPVPLGPIADAILNGETIGPTPSLLERSDGQCLLYPGEVHQFAGEPESGKGWLACFEAVRQLQAGRRVAYMDFEDTAVNVVSRTIALGATADQIINGLVYVAPSEALVDDRALLPLLNPAPALVILDGTTEAYALLGLDVNSNTDAATFLNRIARPFATAGAAVYVVDHVTKNTETRGRFAAGAGHKLAGVAVAYGVEAIERPSRTHPGKLKITLAKDRHGAIPGARGATIALATITPSDNGRTVTVRLDPPDSSDRAGHFRPTVLMEKVSRYVEEHPACTRNQVKTAVSGKTDAKDLALSLLVEEGWIDRERAGQAQRHTSVRAYRENTDPGPTDPPVPNQSPTGPRDQSNTTGPPVPTPYKGDRDRGPVHGTTTTNQPDPDNEIARLRKKGLEPAALPPADLVLVDSNSSVAVGGTAR